MTAEGVAAEVSTPGAAVSGAAASTLGAPTSDLLAKLVDTKNALKFPSFSGETADWNDFKFRFEAAASLLGLDTMMDRSCLVPETELQGLLGPDLLASKLLFSLLVNSCKGKSLAIMRVVSTRTGLSHGVACSLSTNPTPICG